MKIVGQSTIVGHAPYVHLGYLAATTTIPNGPLAAGGLAVLGVGAALALALVGARRAPAWNALSVIRRRFAVLLVGATALAVLGVVGVVLARVHGEVVLAFPDKLTSMSADLIQDAIIETWEQRKPISADLAALGLTSEDVIDGWGRPMRLVETETDGVLGLRMLSAGADGVFDTDDDIRRDLYVPDFEAPRRPGS